MDKQPSKKQLMEIIKKQEEDLSRYKKRFQDVVVAHKRLMKEKEALELSLKVMSQDSSQSEIPISGDFDSSSNESSTASPLKDEDGLSKSNESAEEHLRTQLSTLMQSLATLSSEKSRMEASFQADKRALRVEKEEQENTIKELKKKLEQLNQTHINELENYKAKLIVERHQREKEHYDHGAMIRELQKLLAEERSGQEKANGKERDELKRELQALRVSVEQKDKELESMRRRLHNDGSAPLLASLQQEMSAMKEQHTVAIQREQDRASEAERRAKKLAVMHEERVANLEARLAELSQTVGGYDRLRQEDQCAIQKLKERLVQLEIDHDHEDREKEKGNVGVDLLVDKLKHIKSLIEAANRSVEKPVDIQAALFGDGEMNSVSRYSSSDHSLCDEEYRLLKEEFEAFKRHLNQHSIHSYSPSHDDSTEIEKLKLQLKSFKEKIHILQGRLDDTENYYKDKLDECQKASKIERVKWENKLSTAEQDFRSRLADVELQIGKQRERALALVRDKDEEIASLKASFHSLLPSPVSSRLSSRSPEKDNHQCCNRPSVSAAGIPQEAAEVATKTAASSGDVFEMSESRPMLHYIQELSRMQVDVAKLRKQKHRLETVLRDIQLSSAEEKEALLSKIDKLSQDVARLERCQTREGANLEYLKNVVLSYLLTNDDKSKLHMLNAIAAVLQFSDSEKIKVSLITTTYLHKVNSQPQ